MKAYLSKIRWNTGVQAIGKLVIVLLSLINISLLTRYLGQKGFGDFTLVFIYLSFFGILADFGLQLTMSRDLAKENQLSLKIYGTFFWIKFLLGLASILIGIALLSFFPYNHFLKKAIIIASLGIFLGYINNFGTIVFQAKLRLDWVALVDIVSRVATTAFIFLMISTKGSFYTLVSSILIGNLFALLLIIFLLQKVVKFNLKFDFLLAKKIIKKSIPVGIIAALTLLYFRVDILILSILKGTKDVGIFSLAYKVIENLMAFWGLYMATVYPLLATLLARKKTKVAKSIWKNSMRMALAISVFFIILGYPLAPLGIKILGGEEFSASVLPLRILLFSLPLLFINNLFFHSFLLKEESKFLIKALSCSITIGIILNIIFIPIWGYISIGFNILISQLFLMFCYVLKNKLKFDYVL